MDCSAQYQLVVYPSICCPRNLLADLTIYLQTILRFSLLFYPLQSCYLGAHSVYMSVKWDVVLPVIPDSQLFRKSFFIILFFGSSMRWERSKLKASSLAITLSALVYSWCTKSSCASVHLRTSSMRSRCRFWTVHRTTYPWYPICTRRGAAPWGDHESSLQFFLIPMWRIVVQIAF